MALINGQHQADYGLNPGIQVILTSWAEIMLNSNYCRLHS